MVNHLRFTLGRNSRTWLIYAAALFVIQVALAAVFQQAGTGLPGGLGMLINLLPDAVRDFVGSRELDLLTANGMLAVAYNHPLSKIVLSVFAVGLSASAIAGELERGTLDLVLARPLRRYKLLLGSGLAFLLACCIMGGIMLLGTLIGSQAGGIGDQVVWSNFYWLTLNAIALMLAMSGLGYLFSALTQRGSHAIFWAGGLVAGMFFLYWFSTLWDKVKPFAVLSLFYYYRPEQIINGAPDWWFNITVLLAVCAVTFGLALFIFERRDLTR